MTDLFVVCNMHTGFYDGPHSDAAAEKALYFARLFAQAEKMKEALEKLSNSDHFVDKFAMLVPSIRIIAEMECEARAALAELSETNDEH